MIKEVPSSNLHSSLPVPTKEELEHSHNLTHAIINNIHDNNGWLSFKDYMALALYHPLYGYYTSGSRKIGASGDFITAPELGPLFSFSLAQQTYPILRDNPDFDILEFGAGTGKLAENLLLELDKLNQLPNHYYILEVSAELKDRQQKSLHDLPEHISNKIVWLDNLPEDNTFNGIVIANEVIDAMPIHLFQYDDDKLTELGLCSIENNLVWQTRQADQKLANYIEEVITPFLKQELGNITSYISEVNLLANDWLESLSQCISNGIVMIIDYGYPRHEYYHHDRCQGTLMCYYRHHAHQDPLLYPGLQDITSHVDFTSLAETAVHNDLDVSCFTNQAGFLIANNITDYINNHQKDNNVFKLKQNLHKLTSPSEMGELFKVLLLSKNLSPEYFEHLQPYDKRGFL